MTSPVGVPRCSDSITISVRPAVFADRTVSSIVVFPLFTRILVGNSSLTSLEKAVSREEQDLDVVIRTVRVLSVSSLGDSNIDH